MADRETRKRIHTRQFMLPTCYVLTSGAHDTQISERARTRSIIPFRRTHTHKRWAQLPNHMTAADCHSLYFSPVAYRVRRSGLAVAEVRRVGHGEMHGWAATLVG